MFHKHAWKLSLAMLALLPMYGCSGGNMDMAEAMKAPPRAAELDKLDMFVGRWEAEMDMPGPEGKTIKCKSVSQCSWDPEKRWMTEKWEMDMGEMGGMHGTLMYTYDASKGCFRSWYFDTNGDVGEGTSTYDESTKTWKFQFTGRNMATGNQKCGEGTMKMVDAGTMECTFREWPGAWRIGKPAMEMSCRSYKR